MLLQTNETCRKKFICHHISTNINSIELNCNHLTLKRQLLFKTKAISPPCHLIMEYHCSTMKIRTDSYWERIFAYLPPLDQLVDWCSPLLLLRDGVILSPSASLVQNTQPQSDCSLDIFLGLRGIVQPRPPRAGFTSRFNSTADPFISRTFLLFCAGSIGANGSKPLNVGHCLVNCVHAPI